MELEDGECSECSSNGEVEGENDSEAAAPVGEDSGGASDAILTALRQELQSKLTAYSCTASSCISIQHFSPEDVSGPRDAPTQASASGDVRVDREEEVEEVDKVPPPHVSCLCHYPLLCLTLSRRRWCTTVRDCVWSSCTTS